MKSYIIYRGVHSDAMGVRITKLPALIAAQERVQSVKVPAKSGTLTVVERNTPTYEAYKAEIEGVVLPGSDIYAVMDWLSKSGQLICSTDPAKYQDVRIIDAVSYERIGMVGTHRSFAVTMECQPYRYLHPPAMITLTSPGELTNPGNVESEPIITVYGSGMVYLTVGTRVVLINNLSGSIVIDCEMKTAYQPGTPLILKTGSINVSEDIWPTLPTGKAYVSWTGNVTKVEIQPKWKWR